MSTFHLSSFYVFPPFSILLSGLVSALAQDPVLTPEGQTPAPSVLALVPGLDTLGKINITYVFS